MCVREREREGGGGGGGRRSVRKFGGYGRASKGQKKIESWGVVDRGNLWRDYSWKTFSLFQTVQRAAGDGFNWPSARIICGFPTRHRSMPHTTRAFQPIGVVFRSFCAREQTSNLYPNNAAVSLKLTSFPKCQNPSEPWTSVFFKIESSDSRLLCSERPFFFLLL